MLELAVSVERLELAAAREAQAIRPTRHERRIEDPRYTGKGISSQRLAAAGPRRQAAAAPCVFRVARMFDPLSGGDVFATTELERRRGAALRER